MGMLALLLFAFVVVLTVDNWPQSSLLWAAFLIGGVWAWWRD